METPKQWVKFVQSSRLTIKPQEQRIVNFTHFTHCSCVSSIHFEQVNTGWVIPACLCRSKPLIKV